MFNALLFPSIYFFISLAGLAIASYTDLKNRIVSNKLSYSMLALGLGLHAIEAFLVGSIVPITYSAGLAIAAFLGSYVLWRLGVWAGGDVKIFTALAALNPLNLGFFGMVLGYGTGLLGTISLPVFPLTLFVFSIFSIIPYGFFLTLNALRKNPELKRIAWGKTRQVLGRTARLAALVAGAEAILLQFNLSSLLVLVFILAAGFLKKKKQAAFIIAVLVVGIILKPVQAIEAIVLGLALIGFGYLFWEFYHMSKEYVLRKTLKITELEEGMISAETIVEKELRVERLEQPGIGKIINLIFSNRVEELKRQLKPAGKTVASAKSAAGFTLEQIRQLKELVKQKKLEDKIQIKLSAPFVPAVLVAYVILNFAGDILWAFALT